jgi:hypothetical protein
MHGSPPLCSLRCGQYNPRREKDGRGRENEGKVDAMMNELNGRWRPIESGVREVGAIES